MSAPATGHEPMTSRSRAVAAAILSMLCVAQCSKGPDIQFLTSDTHFSVGGQHIVVPVVAFRGPDHTFDLSGRRPEKSMKERLRSEASDPGNPMTMDLLPLIIREYQYYVTAEAKPSSEICPLLTRAWSQAVCRGEHRGLLRRLPEKFDLVDRARLDLLKNHWTVGKERKYDQVKDMAMQPGVTEIGCDRDSRFCTALVQVLPGLLAVWTVWSDDKTASTAEQMALTQGAAIVAFVRRALAAAEDPTLVNAD
jgi:hypothetical protein